MPSYDAKTGLRYPDSRWASPLEVLANIDEIQRVGGPTMPTAPGAPGVFSRRVERPTFDDPANVSVPLPSPESQYGNGEGSDLMDRVTRHATPEEYAADVPGFLARGSSPEIGQMADAMGARQAIDDNMLSGRRPDLLRAEQGRLAIGGLRNARQREAQQLDPSFARQNAALDDISEAETFMHPSVMGQRQQQQREGFRQARGMQDIEIGGKTDPRVLGLLFQQWLQQQQLAQINASGRNPFGNLLGGGGGASPPKGGGAGGRVMTAAQVRQDVINQGGSEADVADTIADLQSRGITVQ
jgi:hypothetical protein